MSDDTIPDGDEWDRPTLYQFTSPLRMIEMLRADLEDVAFLSLNHFAILLIIFEMEDERFGLEAQTIHSLAGVEKSTANRIVHSLSDKGRSTRDGLGYVTVKTDVNDRRIRRVFLTEKGRMLKQKLATAGTELDNAEVTKMYQAYDATRVLSREKADGFVVSDAKVDGPYKVKMQDGFHRKTARGTTFVPYGAKREHTKRFALDRAMKTAADDPRRLVRYRGKNVDVASGEEMRRTADTDDYELDFVDGYWMLFDKRKKFSEGPVCIQSNLSSGEELAQYMNGLMAELKIGFSFTDIMRTAQSALNQTEYARLRNRMTKDLADTRDTLMRDTAKKAAEIVDLENAADEAARRGGTFHRMANLELQRLDGIHDKDPEHTEAAIEALGLAAEGLEQRQAAAEMEIEAKKRRDEVMAMQKALDDNAKAMAEMQAMMQKMMEKGD
jgi:DNA-binding MarR family transcriptional regulator